MRIGISLIQKSLNGETGWIAGLYYIKNCLNTLAFLPASQIPDIIVFVPSYFKHALLLPEHAAIASWLKIVTIPCEKEGNAVDLQSYINHHPCDVYFPFNDIPSFYFSGAFISWIPDFQEKHFPHFFSETELIRRELTAQFLLSQSQKIICISQTVAEDIKKFYPAYHYKTATLLFKSIHSRAHLAINPDYIRKKLGISQKYIYLPNQFWVHKNHKMVFAAWKQLIANHKNYLLICTGYSMDYRNKNYFNELLCYIKTHGLEKHIRILGFIPREEQIQLFRNAAAILQPSLFEGWNTSLEDAKAFGKKIILSDTAIHREQCEHNAFYFDKENADALSDLLAEKWDELPEGYDRITEETAFNEYQTTIPNYATDLLSLLKSTVSNESIPAIRYERDLILQLSSEVQIVRAHLARYERPFSQKIQSRLKNFFKMTSHT